MSFILCVLLWSPTVGAVTYPFQDDMESGGENWTAEAPWAMTQAAAHSDSSAWTDSETGYYGNNADASLTLSSALDFSGALSPQLVFWHKYQLEPGCIIYRDQ